MRYHEGAGQAIRTRRFFSAAANLTRPPALYPNEDRGIPAPNSRNDRMNWDMIHATPNVETDAATVWPGMSQMLAVRCFGSVRRR